MTPADALKNIELLLTGTATKLKTDRHRELVLRGVIVIAQKGLGIAPDGVVGFTPNVLPFPHPKPTKPQ